MIAKVETQILNLPAYCNPNSEVRGAKFDRNMDIKEIAKRARADIKSEIKAKRLPKGKYGVRISRYSMGQSCKISIRDIPGMLIANPERVRMDAVDPHCVNRIEDYYTPEASMVIKRLKAILGAYNRDNSDSQSDYFDTNFYGDAVYDWKMVAAQREWIESMPANVPIRQKAQDWK